MWGCKERPFPASCSPSAPPHYSTSLSSPLSFSLQTFSAFTIFSTLLNWSPPAFIIVCFYIFFFFISVYSPSSIAPHFTTSPCVGWPMSRLLSLALVWHASHNGQMGEYHTLPVSLHLLLLLLYSAHPLPVRMSPCCQMEKINRTWALWRLSV